VAEAGPAAGPETGSEPRPAPEERSARGG